jgi:hypothetical protein
MAPDDFWTRKRREEEKEEAEKERAEFEAKSRKKLGLAGPSSAPVSAQFSDLVREIPTVIEQLNHLYSQFISGVVNLPPREVRGRLDQMMVLLTNMAKPTPASRFHFQSVQSSYVTHCERWDKMMRGLESGKVKRVRDRAP